MLKKASRNNDADGPSAPRSEYRWDFAIWWRRGWHVTLFPLGILTVICAIALVALAVMSAILSL